MSIKPRVWACVLGAVLATPSAAQAPLSSIDWLTPQTQTDRMPGTVLREPPVAQGVENQEIQVTPLEALKQPLGLVASSTTGLPLDLWEASDAQTISRLMAQVPVEPHAAMQSLLFTLILSETRAPAGPYAEETLLLARLDRLLALGATDPAQALAQLAGPLDSRARFARWFDATLLTGDEDTSCAALLMEQHLSAGYDAPIFCLARAGDWETAALLLESAHTLELLPPAQLALLDRYLSPDIFEGAPPLPTPQNPDPLTFRLFETIGERLPTAPLPRMFATADLRDVAGWKAQIEAAERLTRVGALHPNHLLGLYTERRPAASGGTWDRVRALQQFDAALTTGSAAAVTKTLPAVWSAMRSVGLEVAFAELFSQRLAPIQLAGDTAKLAWQIRLLSTDYEAVSKARPDDTTDTMFLVSLANGQAARTLATTPFSRAVAQGFSADAIIPDALRTLLDQGRLGETILRAMILFDHGAKGNLNALTDALATFRFVGLEDTARRAALQLVLLERR
jgi:hypothetical protein